MPFTSHHYTPRLSFLNVWYVFWSSTCLILNQPLKFISDKVILYISMVTVKCYLVSLDESYGWCIIHKWVTVAVLSMSSWRMVLMVFICFQFALSHSVVLCFTNRSRGSFLFLILPMNWLIHIYIITNPVLSDFFSFRLYI